MLLKLLKTQKPAQASPAGFCSTLALRLFAVANLLIVFLPVFVFGLLAFIPLSNRTQITNYPGVDLAWLSPHFVVGL
jgi:hypothetical protein